MVRQKLKAFKTVNMKSRLTLNLPSHVWFHSSRQMHQPKHVCFNHVVMSPNKLSSSALSNFSLLPVSRYNEQISAFSFAIVVFRRVAICI